MNPYEQKAKTMGPGAARGFMRALGQAENAKAWRKAWYPPCFPPSQRRGPAPSADTPQHYAAKPKPRYSNYDEETFDDNGDSFGSRARSGIKELFKFLLVVIFVIVVLSIIGAQK